jgi:hypothetical protein
VGAVVTVGVGEATGEALGEAVAAVLVGDGVADTGACVLVKVSEPDTGWPSVLTTR